MQPYRVYEIEELYTEEPHNDLDRHIVSKELIGAGYGKMFSFYALMDERNDQAPIVSPMIFSFYAGTNSICRGEITRSFYWEPEVHGRWSAPQNNIKPIRMRIAGRN